MIEPRVLVVKTSSLGDVVHLMPALTEARTARPDLRFDWLVEAPYASVVARHPGVDGVLPVALRRWRRRPWSALAGGEWSGFCRALRARRYELVIDAQGLVKSALLAMLANGPVTGPDAASAREPLASRLYARRIALPARLHAVDRLRRLLAVALEYPLSTAPPATGLSVADLPAPPEEARAAVVLIHGTTWASKHWPEAAWRGLAERLCAAGVHVALPWGTPAERARAARIAAGLAYATVLPALELDALGGVLAAARAAVGVDAGPLHLAAALGTPTVGLYGPTDPARTGAWGPAAVNLGVRYACAPCRRPRCSHPDARSDAPPPCFETLTPARVLAALRDIHGVIPPRGAA